jgi:Uma2 family endonuclease
LFTYADLATFPDDNLRRELIDGELIVSPAPRTRHQQIVGRLHLLLGNHVEAFGGGEVYLAPTDVVLSDINVLEPDLLFIAEAQLEILNEKNVSGPPALVIEVLSNPRIDKVRKREVYGRFGVPEYWVVDGETDRIEVHHLNGDRYDKPELFEPGDRLRPGALPDLEIDLGLLFRR